MKRSFFLTLAAVVALASTPSFAVSPVAEDWQQASRQFAAYAFAGIDAVETGSIAMVGSYVPYTGFGDPAGLTASVDAIETGSIEVPVGTTQASPSNAYIPPIGLMSTDFLDTVATGSIREAELDYVPYAGLGDPLGLTSSVYVDTTTTGSIVETPRADVRAFCEGEGKELAEHLYVGFCHLADDLE